MSGKAVLLAGPDIMKYGGGGGGGAGGSGDNAWVRGGLDGGSGDDAWVRGGGLGPRLIIGVLPLPPGYGESVILI